MPAMTAAASPDTAHAGGCSTLSGRARGPRSPTPPLGTASRPAGVRPGSRCGPTWIRGGPGLPCWTRPTATRATPGPPTRWTRSSCASASPARRTGPRRPGSEAWPAPAGVPFRDWLRDGGSGALRAPTAEDLDYHLSTLFPPVRPRGHMELRMIDAQPGDGWIVPAAVVTALADDDRAADAALAAAEPVWEGSPDAGDPWLRAGRCGPAHPVISRASKRCFETAEAALMRSGAPTEIRQAVSEFTEQYVQKDRCPADDQLEGAR